MRIVISAILVVTLVFITYWVITKLPTVQSLSDCYKLVSESYDQKHVITRRSYTSEQQICEEQKALVIKAGHCFYEVRSSFVGSDTELDVLKWAAKNVSRTTRTLDETIEKHNEKCNYPSAQVSERELIPDTVY